MAASKKLLIFIIFLGLSISNFAMPAQIIIFPHADKQTNGPHLSPQGIAEAKALQGYILSKENLKPDAVIANSTPNQRALGSIETCQPIADALQVPVESNFLEAQSDEMMQTLLNDPKYNGKKILICWDKHDMAAMRAFVKANKNISFTLLTPQGYAPGFLFK